MNLKQKISLIISIVFSVIFAFASVVIYGLFSDFRKDEFESRLREKAISSINLLLEIQQFESHLIKTFDQNSIHRLYDEKTLIFDGDYNLIYSSIDDSKIQWSKEDLQYLKMHGSFLKKENDKEVYGFYYDTQDKDFYVLVSANDNNGKRKLEYLLFILILTYVVFTAIAWIVTYKTVQKLLFPLDTFHNKIKGINEQNLDTRIAVKKAGDEIDLLANEFNLMLGRIDISYKKQKEFTSNASHELRTPIARMMAQIENRLNDPSDNAETKEFYQLLLQDINQLNELTNSLLILSKHNRDNANLKERCRIDEIIYECADVIKKQFDDFKLEINFDSVETMEMEGIKSLLDIAFQNLLRNAYQYSSNKSVKVNIFSDDEIIRVQIENDGPTLTEEDQSKLFETFMRGSNARDKSGLGLGLRIVQRIFNQHDAGVHYKISERNTNVFEVIFRI